MKKSKIPINESETVEFKTSFNTETVESLVAFANTKGGCVYIGVTDTGSVAGVSTGKETIPQWINEIKNKTNPHIIPDVEILTIDNKTVVALTIQEYPVKPISTRGKYFKRVGQSNHLLNIEEIANEYLKTINSSWDFYIDPHHSLSDLSEEKIKRFTDKIRKSDIFQQEISDWEILNKLEIIRKGELTFGAYLLFVNDYCSISDVQIGRFKSDITIIDSLSLNTDLFREIDDIIAFIKKHLKVEYIITGNPQRTERLDYPLDAIREIVVNLVVHRDYRESSASIIKIFDNRIEFYNPGKLYGGITVQDLLSGNYTSKSRNKLIAKVFKEVGMIERYGSGIIRVRNICNEYGIREPEFNEISNGFQVILYNDKVPENTVEKSVEESREEGVKKTVEKSVEESVKKSREESVEESREESREESVEKSREKNVEKSREESVKKSVEESVTDTMEKSVKDSVEKSRGKNVEESREESVEKSREETVEKSREETVEKSRGKNVEKSRGKNVEKSKDEIIKLIDNNNFITQKELAKSTGLSIKGIEKKIHQLKENGLIERIGPKKGGYWKVKQKK